MDYDVKPGVGVGELAFGMTRGETREILGEPTRSVLRNEYAESPLDLYADLGITTNFDSEDKLEIVEFSGPASPTYDDVDLLKLESPEVWIEEQDEDAEIDLPDVTSNALSIAFYLPESGNRSVGIFRPGYYD